MRAEGEASAGRDATWRELCRAAQETFGEERSAEALLQAALAVSATALWRVSEEPLEPFAFEPLSRND